MTPQYEYLHRSSKEDIFSTQYAVRSSKQAVPEPYNLQKLPFLRQGCATGEQLPAVHKIRLGVTD